MLENGCALAAVVLVESDALMGTGQKLRQAVLPPLDRQGAQVIAIEAPKVPRPRHLRRPLVVSGAVAATKSDPVDDEYFA
jgi:hypothetical protein